MLEINPEHLEQFEYANKLYDFLFDRIGGNPGVFGFIRVSFDEEEVTSFNYIDNKQALVVESSKQDLNPSRMPMRGFLVDRIGFRKCVVAQIGHLIFVEKGLQKIVSKLSGNSDFLFLKDLNLAFGLPPNSVYSGVFTGALTTVDFSGKSVIEAGAEFGTQVAASLNLGASQVYAYEKDPESFQILKSNVGKDSRVVLIKEDLLETRAVFPPVDILLMNIGPHPIYGKNTDFQIMQSILTSGNTNPHTIVLGGYLEYCKDNFGKQELSGSKILRFTSHKGYRLVRTVKGPIIMSHSGDANIVAYVLEKN